ncbi:hypothetical protein ACFVZL_34820 [Streptomyces sp. NPDC058320]|uniref:hypothetical protein n=1 Tax=unclassified Streptomyces TaxID=2593676 RepID=UPI00362FFFC1
MPMSGQQRTQVWRAAIAALVAIVGTLVALFATDTIGGDRNECSNQAVCGHDNDTNFGNSSGPTGDRTDSQEPNR